VSNDNSLFGGMQRLLNPTIYREAADAPNTTRGDRPQDETNDPNAGALPVLGDQVTWADGSGIVDRITPDGMVKDVENTPVMGTADQPALRIAMIMGGVTHYLAMKASAVKKVQVSGEQAVKAALRESIATEMEADLVRFVEASSAPRVGVGDMVSFPGGIGKVTAISTTGPLAGSRGPAVSGNVADPALLVHVILGGTLSSPMVSEAVRARQTHIVQPHGDQMVALQEAAVAPFKENLARSGARQAAAERAARVAATRARTGQRGSGQTRRTIATATGDRIVFDT